MEIYLRTTGLIGRLVIAISSNDTLSNPANLTTPMRASLLYAARCKTKAALGRYEVHDVITDVIRPGSTIRENHLDKQHRRTLC